MKEQLARAELSWTEKETHLSSQHEILDERVETLTKQNNMLHEEAEKVGVNEGGMISGGCL